MLSEEKRARLVARLITMTNGGGLRWHVLSAPNGVPEDDVLRSEEYGVVLNEIEFIIYQIRRKRRYYYDEVTSEYGFGKMWETKTALSLRDPESHVVFDTITDVDRMPILKNLYEAARRSVTDIDERIDAFLAQEENHAERHHG